MGCLAIKCFSRFVLSHCAVSLCLRLLVCSLQRCVLLLLHVFSVGCVGAWLWAEGRRDWSMALPVSLSLSLPAVIDLGRGAGIMSHRCAAVLWILPKGIQCNDLAQESQNKKQSLSRVRAKWRESLA